MFRYLLFTAACFLQCFSQAPATDWEYLYGGPGNDFQPTMISTQDGGYLISTSTWPPQGAPGGPVSHCEILVIKLDASGILEWEHTYNSRTLDFRPTAAQTPDGGFVIAGSVRNTMETGLPVDSDIWIFKIDSSGNMLWDQTFVGEADEYSANIKVTSDGGFILAAETYTDGPVGDTLGYYDAVLMRLDADGSLIWQKTYGGSNSDKLSNVIPIADGYILAGDTGSVNGDVSNNHGFNDFWLVQVNESGNMVWEKTFGGSLPDNFASFKATPDGGYILAGHTYSSDGDVSVFTGATDCWVLKTNADGMIEWEKTYGNEEDNAVYDIIPTADGGYVVAGYTDQPDPWAPSFAWMFKTDSTGEMQWDILTGGEGNRQNTGVLQAADGGYVSVGTQGGPFTTSPHNILVRKLDPESLSVSSQELNAISISPNPAKTNLYIHGAADVDIQTIIIFDMTGKKVMEQIGPVHSVDVSSLAAGMYVLETQSDRGKKILRFVKE